MRQWYAYLGLMLLMVSANNMVAQLTAAFTASPTSGCAPLVVQFTNQAVGNPTSYFWDLGNGVTSDLPNPSTTYFNAGSFPVKLVIRRGNLKDSIVKLSYIKVEANPIIDFTVSSLTGCAPLAVNFTNQTTVQNSSIQNYLWDFGNGDTSASINPSYTYNTSGTYSISLTATSVANCKTSITKPNLVAVSPKPVASFVPNIAPSCTAPVSVTFNNTSTGNGLTYAWNFGDPNSGVLNTSTALSPSHIFNAFGAYVVSLTVTNALQCVDTYTYTINVGNGAIDAIFTIPATACVGEIVPIVQSSNPTPSAVAWNFDDGTSSTQLTPIKVYNSLGTYNISLTATIGQCSATITKPITIVAKPVAQFAANTTQGCSTPFSVIFNNTSTGNGLTYAWSFGDGQTSTATNPTHTYTATGSYNVTLIVVNAAGCADTLTRSSYITITKPVVTLNNILAQGCVPFVFTPSFTVNTTTPIISYNWNFGNGQTSNLPNPTATYTTQNTYTIKLYYTTQDGCSDSVIATNALIVGNKPRTAFSINPQIACANETIQFTDNTPPPVNEWVWLFGDGATSTAQNPTYMYSDTGFFNVTLITINNGCRDTLTKNNAVYIKPPIAIFEVVNNCSTPYVKNFTDLSIGAETWLWNFGEPAAGANNTSINPNPVHTYATTGVYTVTLIVTNGTCSYTRTQQVNVVDEQPNFQAAQTVLCKGVSTSFNTTNINATNIMGYSWNFGDNTLATGNPVSHAYSQFGTYTVTLTTTDILGCTDIIEKPNYITVYGPTANFTVANPNICAQQTKAVFTNTSITDGIHNITTYVWNYGDNSTETLTGPPFEHTYTMVGNYNVSLKITDSYGCVDSITKQNIVSSTKPIANFTTNDTLSCPTKNITFINQSTPINNTATYVWNFGDQLSATEINPTHVYNADGLYTVSLKVTDAFGCVDSIVKNNLISIKSPKALFTISDNFKTCPPLIANFTNNSVNNIANNWNFDDGTTSSLVSPSHVFTTAGTYNTKLVVTSNGGCQDSLLQQVIIQGPSGSFTYNPLAGCTPLTVNFNATANNTANYIWDFSDGNTTSATSNTASHVYNNIQSYLPKLILEDAQGCRVPIVGKDSIKLYGVAGIIKANKNLLCGITDGAVQFTDSIVSNDRYSNIEWYFGDGFSISSLTPPVHNYQATGTYYPYAAITTANGCLDTLRTALPIRFVDKPILLLTTDTSKCIPASFTINVANTTSDTTAFTYSWNIPFVSNTNIAEPPQPININTVGSYVATAFVTDGFGCKDTASRILEVRPLPIINAGIDTTICQGSTTQLTASGGINYTWTPNYNISCDNCSNPIASPVVDTLYTVIGTSQFGCVNKDSVFVKVFQPFILTSTPGGVVCVGNGLPLNANGADKYVWLPNNGTISNPNIKNPIVTPRVTTTYSVIGSDRKNCFSDTAEILVTVIPKPTVNAGPDQSVIIGNAVTINTIASADVVKYAWLPSTYLNCTSCANPLATPLRSTNYIVEVTNNIGCTAKDTVSIYVICESSNLFIPNTFSPNNDGSNDVFYIRANGKVEIANFKIFNRWGQEVFSRSNVTPNDPTQGWNGAFNNSKLTSDVYVYMLDILCDKEKKTTIKGNVTLLR
jgi:gliding motility-associated-like protein